MSDFQHRYLRPFLLPIGAFVFVGGFAWGLSRMLLSTTKQGSVVLALGAATAVLLGSAVIAARGFHFPQKVAMALAFVGIVAGGSVFAATLGIRPVESVLPAPSFVITAHSPVGFDSKEIKIADVKSVMVIRFTNDDTSNQHNWTLVKSKSDQNPIVPGGAPFKGVASHDYILKGLTTGAYYYFCAVHPSTMFGNLILGNAKAPATAASTPAKVKAKGKPGVGPVSASITASSSSGTPLFSVPSITLRANAPTTVVMINSDAGIPHNFQVSSDAAFSSVVFSSPIFNGVATKSFKIPAVPAGTYYFHCIVHPGTMKGTIQFK
ncbi:MAG: cupredoxin domain-containing protein [Actinomycetota bacterium]